MRGWVSPLSTAFTTLSTVAFSYREWPMATAGALWQPPMQGARTTRTPEPSAPGSCSSSASPPAMQQDRLSHTRTVTGGGASSSSMTMSKWA